MNCPTVSASLQSTPISQATGGKTQPSSFWNVRSSAPNHPPMPLRRPLASAMSEMEAIRSAPTITAIRPPARAPRAVASITLADSVSRTSRTTASLSERSVSGSIVLVTHSAPGAFITLAASRYGSGAPSSE